MKKIKKPNLIVEKTKVSERNPDIVVSGDAVKEIKVGEEKYEKWVCKNCKKSILKSISNGIVEIESFNQQPVFVEFRQIFTVCKNCGTPNFISENTGIFDDLYKDPRAFSNIYKTCINSKKYQKIMSQDFKNLDQKFKRLNEVLDKYFLGT